MKRIQLLICSLISLLFISDNTQTLAFSRTPLIETKCLPLTAFTTTRRFIRRPKSSTLLYSIRNKEKETTATTTVTTTISSENDDEEESLILGFPKDTVATPLALLLVSQFMLFIGVGAVIPSIPLYGKEIGLSSAANGLVISAPAVALLIGAKFGGNFADVARKPAMLAGMVVIAISDLGTALANGLVTLIVARLGLGAGRCVSEAGERGMLADLAGKTPELRGRALAAQQATIALGIAIGAPIGGIVVEKFGPRAAFLCVTAAAIITCLIYLFLPETIGYNKEEDDNEDDNYKTNYNKQSSSKETSSSEGKWTTLLSLEQWRGLALCQCGASFGFAAKIASIPILAASVLPGGAAGAGALISIAGLSGIVGAPVGGWLTDRTSAKSTAMLSGLVSSTGLILIPLALSLGGQQLGNNDISSISLFGLTDISLQAAAFSAAVILWSTGAAAQGPALTALAQEMAPLGAEATAMALPRATGDATYIFAPFILGVAADTFLSMPGIECAIAGSAGVLGITALGILRGEKEKPIND